MPNEQSPSIADPSVTAMLRQWGRGDREAMESVLPLIYGELRQRARRQLREQRKDHTLRTTALIHEAFLRLSEDKKFRVENREHFLGIAAQLMRWILVDHERRRRAAKRGSGVTCVSLGEAMAAEAGLQTDVDVLALDQALTQLAALDEQQSQIVELRYFGGLSIEQTAEFLGISPATVKRDWASARAWLLRELQQAAPPA
jgi:RNA polymerase sigma factor (TIGR02999 family)